MQGLPVVTGVGVAEHMRGDLGIQILGHRLKVMAERHPFRRECLTRHGMSDDEETGGLLGEDSGRGLAEDDYEVDFALRRVPAPRPGSATVSRSL